MNTGSMTQIPGGEVGPPLVDVCVAPVAGAVAGLARDLHLRCSRFRPGCECVEFAGPNFAAEDGRELLSPGLGEVLGARRPPSAAVEECPVVDPDGLRLLVFDDGAVDEGAHVAQGRVVQIGAREPLRDGLGQLRSQSCMSASRLAIVTDSSSPDGRSATRARILSGRVSCRRRLWARLALIPRSAHTAAVRSSSRSPGARRPAVAELVLLVDEAELLALVGLGLDAADLVGARLVVEQQHDQTPDGVQGLEPVAAGERLAGLRG